MEVVRGSASQAAAKWFRLQRHSCVHAVAGQAVLVGRYHEKHVPGRIGIFANSEDVTVRRRIRVPTAFNRNNYWQAARILIQAIIRAESY